MGMGSNGVTKMRTLGHVLIAVGAPNESLNGDNAVRIYHIDDIVTHAHQKQLDIKKPDKFITCSTSNQIVALTHANNVLSFLAQLNAFVNFLR